MMAFEGGLKHRVEGAARRNSTVSADSNSVGDDGVAIAKGGVAVPFPWKVHIMLDAVAEEGLDHVVSWQTHGRSFLVHKPKIFVELVMSRFFSQTKYASFQRQLNLYGFARFAHGQDKGAYFHFNFVRGHRSLVRGMIRRKVKGTKIRRPLRPGEEPNFYSAEWKNQVTALPNSMLSAPSLLKAAVSVSPQNSPPVSPRQSAQMQAADEVPSMMANIEPLTKEETWDSVDEQILDGGDLLFFEGSPFHYLETATADDLDPLQACSV